MVLLLLFTILGLQLQKLFTNIHSIQLFIYKLNIYIYILESYSE